MRSKRKEKKVKKIEKVRERERLLERQRVRKERERTGGKRKGEIERGERVLRDEETERNID